jgi:hypothetical protein
MDDTNRPLESASSAYGIRDVRHYSTLHRNRPEYPPKWPFCLDTVEVIGSIPVAPISIFPSSFNKLSR